MRENHELNKTVKSYTRHFCTPATRVVVKFIVIIYVFARFEYDYGSQPPTASRERRRVEQTVERARPCACLLHHHNGYVSDLPISRRLLPVGTELVACARLCESLAPSVRLAIAFPPFLLNDTIPVSVCGFAELPPSAPLARPHSPAPLRCVRACVRRLCRSGRACVRKGAKLRRCRIET